MRIPTLLAVAVAAIAFAGCSTSIDEKKAEKTITSSVEDQVGADVKSVDCPSGLKAKKGGTFQCTVTGADGSTGKANVVMTDDKGNVRVSAPFIHKQELEKSIGDSITQQVGANAGDVTVTCPDIITAEKGGKLQCQAKYQAQTLKLDVTQTDAQGHVTFKVAKS
jgi:predicted phage tail protein